MKKEIYIIKNDINKKVYIGQAVNSHLRFNQHRVCGKNYPGKSLIDDAIFEFGEEHFWCEVLEVSEDYNEREKFWINYFNCLSPNGYNQTRGGSGLEYGIYNLNAAIKDEKILKSIIEDICNSQLKLIEIADKYQVSLNVISAINRGTSYKDSERSYPLRARCSDNLEKGINDLIAYDLKNTTKTRRMLSQEYRVSTFILVKLIVVYERTQLFKISQFEKTIKKRLMKFDFY